LIDLFGGSQLSAKRLGRLLAGWVVLTGPLGWAAGDWRSASPAELTAALPARAPVLSERIETEMRSASGVVDEHGRLIAGVVLITAGYSANGKYSDYLLVQTPIRVAGTTLPPGGYLLGWARSENNLLVTLSEAPTGRVAVQVSAHRNDTLRRVEQLRIWPAPHGMIQLGRFTFDYSAEP
jgi:hypothetical protein